MRTPPYTSLEWPNDFAEAYQELKQTVADLSRGTPPTTVLGALLCRGASTTPETIAGLLDMPLRQVDGTVSMLVEEQLAIRYDDHGVSKILVFAPYDLEQSA